MPNTNKEIFEKLAESWWEKTKRHYGYAMPTWLGGDKRPNFRNEGKFRNIQDAPGNLKEYKADLERRRAKTRVGYDAKPGSVGAVPDRVKARAAEINKEFYAKKEKLKSGLGGTSSGRKAVTGGTRKLTSYERHMRQSIPLKDQPQQSLVGVPLRSQPDPQKVRPKPSAPPSRKFDIKMRSGRGYGWLAKQMNKQLSSGGHGALKPVSAASLRKRMGGQMLYRNKKYSFDPTNLSRGGDISGGVSVKGIARARKARDRFVLGRSKRRANIDTYAKETGRLSYADMRKTHGQRYKRRRYDRALTNARDATPIVQQFSRGELTAEQANKLLAKYNRRVARGAGGRISSTSVRKRRGQPILTQEQLQAIANRRGQNQPLTRAATR